MEKLAFYSYAMNTKMEPLAMKAESILIHATFVVVRLSSGSLSLPVHNVCCGLSSGSTTSNQCRRRPCRNSLRAFNRRSPMILPRICAVALLLSSGPQTSIGSSSRATRLHCQLSLSPQFSKLFSGSSFPINQDSQVFPSTNCVAKCEDRVYYLCLLGRAYCGC
jgi:hypothetical protein